VKQVSSRTIERHLFRSHSGHIDGKGRLDDLYLPPRGDCFTGSAASVNASAAQAVEMN
jgi:hypothetical protein